MNGDGRFWLPPIFGNTSWKDDLKVDWDPGVLRVRLLKIAFKRSFWEDSVLKWSCKIHGYSVIRLLMWKGLSEEGTWLHPWVWAAPEAVVVLALPLRGWNPRHTQQSVARVGWAPASAPVTNPPPPTNQKPKSHCLLLDSETQVTVQEVC